MFGFRKISSKMLVILGVVVFLLASPGWAFGSEAHVNYPTAVKGEIDLAGWSFARDGPVKLDGQWAFAWQKFLAPADFGSASPEPSGFIRVPGSWEGQRVRGKPLGSYGYATFWLTVKLASPGQTLAVKMPRVATAYRFWADGKLLYAVGEAGDTPETSIPFSQKTVVTFVPQTSEVRLVFQVSNFVLRKAGILESVVIGTSAQINEKYARSVGLEMAVLGGLVIVGLYHLLLFCMRPKDRAALYFGLLCFIVSFRILWSGEIFLTKIEPGLKWAVAFKLAHISTFIGLALMLLLVYRLFPQDLIPRFPRFLVLAAFAASLLHLFIPIRMNIEIIRLYEAGLLIMAVFLLAVLLRAVFRRRLRSVSVWLAVLMITGIIGIDFLFLSGVVHFENQVPFGLFAFILLQSLIFSFRNAQTFRKLEKTSGELVELNLKLEEKIRERTAELEKTNHQLVEANILLRNLSYLDSLTDIPNRRAFVEVLDREWKHAARQKSPISVLMLDIDYFKAYNDKYGHQAGDDCLKKVAGSIQSALQRPKDFLARCGGEEFAIVLPETPLEGAWQVARQVMEAVAAKKITHEGSQVARHITVSIGIASIVPEGLQIPADLIELADNALYQAKHEGRDRIVAASQT